MENPPILLTYTIISKGKEYRGREVLSWKTYIKTTMTETDLREKDWIVGCGKKKPRIRK